MAVSDRQPPDHEGDNWEAVALSRVARHVEELPPPAEAEDFGWEEGILEKLRRHLASIE